jgi:CheY-like chemotaxis protein
MSRERIFIVEDELIVAEDLQRMLERLGYAVAGSAANGKDAIAKIEKTKPDLVLMDIHIQGPMDGIDVAEHIFTQFDIPVSYLTAYADETTLERAKSTMPYGYILKPFEERNLQTTIEMALYRHKMSEVFKRVDDWHAATLQSLNEAIITTDVDDNVTFMNKAAETLAGRTLDAAYGKPLGLMIKTEPGNKPRQTATIDNGGKRKQLEAVCTPILDKRGQIAGRTWVFKDLHPAAAAMAS